MRNESRARQHASVGQGLAVGALLLGENAVNGSPTALEFAFRRAWRRWECAGLFPAVSAGPARDDVLRILSDSEKRGGAAFWHGQWPFVPVLGFSSWQVWDAAEVIDHRVPPDAWQELVAAWLRRQET